MTVWYWVSLLVTSTLGSGAAYQLALRKRRPEKAVKWAWLGLLLPPAIPVLTVWRLRPGAPARSPWFAVPLIAMANLVVLGQLVLGVDEVASAGTLVGLPTCSSRMATGLAKKALEASPMGRASGLAIIDLSGIREVSATPGELRCTAAARLNNGSERTANYRLFARGEGAEQITLIIELQ